VEAVITRRADAVVELVHRLGCVPRFVAARNKQLGSPLAATDLEDVVQDSLVVVWTKLPRFHGRTSLEVWVYRICCYELLNAVRRRGRGGRERRVSDERLEEGEIDVDAEWDRNERHEHLYEALDRLTDEERQIVRMKHFDNLSFTEISQELALSSNTAKTRYYRGVRRLTGFLRARNGGDRS
jgi:RNA polymerase sigma-70 factor (ECF subfamily)